MLWKGILRCRVLACKIRCRLIWHGYSRTQSTLALGSSVKLLRVWPADKWTSRFTAFILNYLFASVFQRSTFLLWGKKYEHLDYCTDCKGATLLEQILSRLALLLLCNPVILKVCGARMSCSSWKSRVMTCFWEFLCRNFPALRDAVQGLQENSNWELHAEIMIPGGAWQFVLLNIFGQSMLQSSKSKARSHRMASAPAQGHL